tara:strand:+ start:3014 stop:3238 length:225 start_codon:yes stop_codon:yes gene_type:complete
LIDALAQRYSALPSKVLFEADTFDIHIINTATAWEQYQSEVAQAKAGKGTMPAPKVPVGKLQEMMDKVRKKDGD